MKTLIVDLRDLETNPLGPDSAVTGVVSAEYVSALGPVDLDLVDGATVPARFLDKHVTQDPVSFRVLTTDDEGLLPTSRGAGVRVRWRLQSRQIGPVAQRVTVEGERTVIIRSTDPDEIRLSLLAPAGQLPRLAGWTEPSETGKALLTAADAAAARAVIEAAPTLHTHAAAQISDSTAVGRAVLTAADAAAVRSAAGAVASSDPRLSDARTPSAHTHAAAQISDSTAVGRAVLTAADAAAVRAVAGSAPASHTHAAADVSDATAVGRAVLKAADAAAARSAIGTVGVGYDADGVPYLLS